jgi:hypothetical protein
MKDWLNENVVSIISTLFGVGSIGYVIITRIINRQKYDGEVRQQNVDIDIKGDEFWKHRYDILSDEIKNKDIWWKERYDNLYKEFQEERKLSNEIIKNFRIELNEIREDYERQKEIDRGKYNELMEQYQQYRLEVDKKNKEQIDRISQLESLVTEYENRLNKNEI